ncbi:PXMP2/4 family protein 4 [Quillaja saponaria]|uniref:PXMP2/4 family protein 4 n=1 Tax=Quillaja saponaria TaxID=32244 RepID=A0AAD7KUN7_QUISA|nr:PXMP2/4 family protein 4 [Quillaja saponaria]
MSGAFLRSSSICRDLLQRNSITHFTYPLQDSFPGNQTHSRTYFRLQGFRRKSKEYVLSPSLISSHFSSSSSSTASLCKIGFVGWYLGMVKTWPVLTKSVTSALIYTAADFSSQMIAESSSEPYNFLRTLRMAGYGMIILGPTLHFWFNFVSKLFPRRDIFSILKKMALGQTIYGPAMTVVFFSLNAGWQGETIEEIVVRLKRDLVPTMLNGVIYWPACDFITFKFIPVHLQPLVSNSFSYLWTIYLTYMASLEKAGGAPSQAN